MNQYHFTQLVTIATMLLSILYVFLIRWPRRGAQPSLLVTRIAWFNRNSHAVQEHFEPKP